MRRSIPMSMLLLSSVCMAQDTYSVETPDGEFEVTETTVEQFPQEVTEVEDATRVAIDANASLGPAFVDEFVGGVSEPDLKDYDEAFRRWQLAVASGDTEIDSNVVIEILGCVLGNLLVTELDMQWVKVTDQYGTDYAVKGRSVEVFSYPFSTVAKRVENEEYDFMYNVFYAIKQAVESEELEAAADR